MMLSDVEKVFRGIDCEVRCDALTRQLYATDASIYQIEPAAVAFPRTGAQTVAVMSAAAAASIPITPRGAGTGLAGGAIGGGIVLDLARHTRQIIDFRPDQRTVRVGPGVVLDQLNEFLRPHGLCFGPDVATSSRATLGGMLANNSSGARAPLYGTTIDHVVSVDVVMADGHAATLSADSTDLPEIRARMDALIAEHAPLIREKFPEILVKRWPAYALDDCLKYPGDLSKIVCGSEGTLAAIVGAEIRLVPLPRQKGLGIVFFSSVQEAMQATVALLALRPAAIEHVDKILFDQTKHQLEFRATRDLLGLDEHPSGAFLIVEFYDDVADRLATLQRMNLGLRTLSLTDSGDMLRVWALRKRGLSLLSGCKGPAKPIAGVEDVAVSPERLPDYVDAIKQVAAEIDLDVSFYGHAASGLLHIRPVVDLHKGESIAKFRKLALEISRVTRDFHGSLTGEHGVGIARAEFMREHLGQQILDLMCRIKELFDPRGIMNPGKIFPDSHRIDSHLRFGDGYQIPVPFEPVLAFAAKDESFVANLEQCNGCGDCRKDVPVMCPTFRAAGDEIMSTRGRANTMRAVLDGRIPSHHPLLAPELDEALSNCLSCKACKKECPSNVDMALLKAELLHARHRKRGMQVIERFVSRFDLLGRMGTSMPRLFNLMLRVRTSRILMEKTLGLAADRPLPPYARRRFETWFHSREKQAAGTRGRVYLFNDCTTRFFEPEIGQACVAVLEAAGFEVSLAETGACCGRPAFSVGRLDTARRFGEKNVSFFASKTGDAPVLFLEPSCYSMFAGDYEELRISGSARVAARCRMFEEFMHEVFRAYPDALDLEPRPMPVAIHAHCHAKALTDVAIMRDLAARVPESKPVLLDTGCCGMAGSFGALRDKYALSVAVAQPLIEAINRLHRGTALISSGTSCRQQISHLTEARPIHMAQWLAAALRPRPR